MTSSPNLLSVWRHRTDLFRLHTLSLRWFFDSATALFDFVGCVNDFIFWRLGSDLNCKFIASKKILGRWIELGSQRAKFFYEASALPSELASSGKGIRLTWTKISNWIVIKSEFDQKIWSEFVVGIQIVVTELI